MRDSAAVTLDPSVAAPSSKALIVYNHLEGQPLELVRLRVCCLQMLNERLRVVMPFVDWNLAPQAWSLAAVLVSASDLECYWRAIGVGLLS